jgi:hypothetical protein
MKELGAPFEGGEGGERERNTHISLQEMKGIQKKWPCILCLLVVSASILRVCRDEPMHCKRYRK